MKWTALLGLLAGAIAANAAWAQPPSLAIKEPRAFGYFIGDTLTREVVLNVGEGQSLDTASIPLHGPVNYWLELSDVKVKADERSDGTTYHLTLKYQTFYAPLDPRRLVIPALTLKVTGGQGTGEVRVPEFGFLTAPIRLLFAQSSQSSGSAVELQPDAPVHRVTTGRERTGMLISGLIALASLTGLAWHQAWWPFRQRPSRPFTEAARYLRANASRLEGTGGYRTALLKLHRAFDISAGKRVLSDDVAAFLATRPEFAPYADQVEHLFSSSRRAFFADDVQRAQAEMPLAALTDLSARLGAAERSGA